ncbi:MAG: flavodoxin family protein [Dehalococcoidales bacterium]|nr:flavodoxin family protein [Dehalococcoidales bacterium]
MKMLVLSGSRNRQGKTAEAINAICRGVAKGGGSSEVVFLPELKLERCRQCDLEGWGICRSEHRCIIEDDFAGLDKKAGAADVVVFANPVYFGDLTESMRGFLERYRRIHFTMGGPGTPGFSVGTDTITAVGLCYAGGSGNGTTSCGANLEKLLQSCGFDVVDMVMARRQNLETKIPQLEMEGEWLATVPTSGKAWIAPGTKQK